MTTAAPPPTSSERLAVQLEAIVTNRLASDKLAIPAIPAAAAKCLRLLKTDDFSTKALTAMLEQDPVLAARVVRVGSSAAYAGAGSEPVTITSAVVRMGTQRLRSLVVEASTQALFESRDRRIAGSFKELLEHSLAVAILARDLAAVSGQSDVAETAYLCGLLHDIGKVVVASLMLEAEKMIGQSRPGQTWVGSDDWLSTIDRCHRAVGVRLCEKWGLPEGVTHAVRDCAEYDSTDRLSAANFVRFGNALAKREGVYPGAVDEGVVGPLILIGRSLLGLDEEVVDKVAQGLRERIKAAA
jgi:putative nucleotidyltransferase with HDIG domain